MKMIAVWGSSGAGKTAVSLGLAAQLTLRKQDVLVVSYDSRTPALPVYLPGTPGLTSVHSLGALLEQTETLSEGALKDKLHPHPKDSRLYFMGLASGEIAGITYKAPERQKFAALRHLLEDSPFAYMIVDCDANPIYDTLTLYALEMAETVLRVATPDIKGYEGLKTQLSWLGGSDSFRIERHVKILNNVYDTAPVREITALFGGVDAMLPHAQDVANKLLAGEMLRGFHETKAIEFETKMKQMCGGILEGKYAG